MLTFEEKLSVITQFPELTRKDVSLGRVNFHYEESASDKKNVVYHLHPNGNGFVYAGELVGYDTNDKGMVNIRDYSADELRAIIEAAIRSLAPKSDAENAVLGDAEEQETWINESNQTLVLIKEDDMWSVYAGLNLDGIFTTYGEAFSYLQEEGFKREK